MAQNKCRIGGLGGCELAALIDDSAHLPGRALNAFGVDDVDAGGHADRALNQLTHSPARQIGEIVSDVKVALNTHRQGIEASLPPEDALKVWAEFGRR